MRSTGLGRGDRILVASDDDDYDDAVISQEPMVRFDFSPLFLSRPDHMFQIERLQYGIRSDDTNRLVDSLTTFELGMCPRLYEMMTTEDWSVICEVMRNSNKENVRSAALGVVRATLDNVEGAEEDMINCDLDLAVFDLLPHVKTVPNLLSLFDRNDSLWPHIRSHNGVECLIHLFHDWVTDRKKMKVVYKVLSMAIAANSLSTDQLCVVVVRICARIENEKNQRENVLIDPMFGVLCSLRQPEAIRLLFQKETDFFVQKRLTRLTMENEIRNQSMSFILNFSRNSEDFRNYMVSETDIIYRVFVVFQWAESGNYTVELSVTLDILIGLIESSEEARKQFMDSKMIQLMLCKGESATFQLKVGVVRAVCALIRYCNDPLVVQFVGNQSILGVVVDLIDTEERKASLACMEIVYQVSQTPVLEGMMNLLVTDDMLSRVDCMRSWGDEQIAGKALVLSRILRDALRTDSR